MAIPITIVWAFIFAGLALVIVWLLIKRKVKGGTIVYENVKYPEEGGGKNTRTESGTTTDITESSGEPGLKRILLRPRQATPIYDREIESNRTEAGKLRIILKDKHGIHGEDSKDS